MGADPIIYCLDHVTDYAQFERLCSDVMAADGYPNIEPLGGFKDKGRDAIHVCRNDPDNVSIFAYSVREDWRDKLDEDAEKIQKHGHACKQLVFLSTADFTATERDTAISDIADDYSWNLELWGLERFRVFLTATRPDIVGKHPQIFTPQLFPHAGGVSLVEHRDYIVIDHAIDDSGLGTWLARRLTLEGYHAWSRDLAPVAGASLSETVESLIETRAFRLISILSPESLKDSEMTARRTLATAIDGGILLPVRASFFDEATLDSKTRELESISFSESWAKGLRSLLESLQAADAPRTTSVPSIAARSFVQPDLVLNETELVVSNRFRVKTTPEIIHRYVASTAMSNKLFEEAKLRWAFRRVDDKKFLSFWEPPDDLRDSLGLKPAGGSLWKSVRDIDDIATRNLGPELMKKSMHVKCIEKGMLFCEDRGVHYFPDALVPSNRLYFTKADGTRSWVGAAGERKFWRPNLSEQYKHFLAVVFSVQWQNDDDYAILIRVRVRLTDDKNVILSRRKIVSRRKHLCRNWWNDDWLHRAMAIMQFLSEDDESISIEEGDVRLEIAARPDQWKVGTRLNEAAILDAQEIREDAIAHGQNDDEEDDDDSDE